MHPRPVVRVNAQQEGVRIRCSHGWIDAEKIEHLARPPAATERRVELPAAQAGNPFRSLQPVAFEFERQLGFAPCRDVLDDGQMEIGLVARLPQRRHAERDPQRAAILVQQALVHRKFADCA